MTDTIHTAIFRCDAGNDVGLGHISRCTMLAKQLILMGIQPYCVTSEASVPFVKNFWPDPDTILILQDGTNTAALLSLLEEQSFSLDIFVIDHYELDQEWEKLVCPKAKVSLAIEDNEREHVTDIVLNPAGAANHQQPSPLLLQGLQYALISADTHLANIQSSDTIRILVSFGGTDSTNATMKTLAALEGIETVQVDVVIGPANPYADEIAAYCANKPSYQIHQNLYDLSPLIQQATIAIGAGGISQLERCAYGLPSLVIATADNQLPIIHRLDEVGCICYLGEDKKVTHNTIWDALDTLLSQPDRLRSLKEHSQKTIDGRGAKRVASIILSQAIDVTETTQDDCDHIYTWRTAPENTQHTRTDSSFSLEEHRMWYTKTLNDPSKKLLKLSWNNQPLAIARYDITGNDAEISLYLVPEMHSKKLGLSALYAADRWLTQHIPTINIIHALVNEENIISLVTFNDAGYIFLKADQEWHILQKTIRN